MDNVRENNVAEADVGSGAYKTGGGPLTVGDVMTRRVVTLNPHHSFSDSVSLMTKHSFRHFLVVDAAGRLVGVVSDRDILRELARTSNWHRASVAQFMSYDLVYVKPDTQLSVAVGKMLSKRINCLPVVDDHNSVCGIITSTDLLKAYRPIQLSLEQGQSQKSPRKKKRMVNFR